MVKYYSIAIDHQTGNSSLSWHYFFSFLSQHGKGCNWNNNFLFDSTHPPIVKQKYLRLGSHSFRLLNRKKKPRWSGTTKHWLRDEGLRQHDTFRTYFIKRREDYFLSKVLNMELGVEVMFFETKINIRQRCCIRTYKTRLENQISLCSSLRWWCAPMIYLWVGKQTSDKWGWK